MGAEKCFRIRFVEQDLSRMESVCAGEGFYQRQTLTGIPVWDCPSNSCVPQEALHKKQLKNAQRHFICRRPTHGEHLESRFGGFSYFKPPNRPTPSFKKKPPPWKSPLTHRSGGSCPAPPLSLRAHTHLTTPNCDGSRSRPSRRKTYALQSQETLAAVRQSRLPSLPQALTPTRPCPPLRRPPPLPSGGHREESVRERASEGNVGKRKTMYQTLLLSSSLFILHAMGTPQFSGHHGRRVCGRDLRHSVVTATESYVQPVHKPYITLCQGHRVCSTYKTVYSVAYRQVSRAASTSHSYLECCPGWRRLHSHNCNQAVCGQACLNGGTCLRPNQCSCPLGWTGHQCQTDVDECCERRPCAQECVNTAGSYRCACRGGYRLARDGRSCQSLPPTPPPPAPPAPPTRPATLPPPTQTGQTAVGGHPDAGGGFSLAENMTEEVQSLRNRVELLEKKLQLVLTPFSSFFPLSLDEGLSEKTTLLSHSFQQLDRIDSLSEQIGFLEERLGTCSCQEN